MQPLSPRSAAAAAKAPVDAMVFFHDPKPNQGLATAMQALDGAEMLPRGAERKTQVFQSLSAISTAARADAMPTLLQLQKSGQIAGVDTLWSFNAVRVRGASLEALRALAGPTVAQIVPDTISATVAMPSSFSDPINGAAQLSSAKPGVARTQSPPPNEPPAGTVYMDWGVQKMRASEAWKQGITGAGVVVADLDTGVDYQHPGLKANFRGTKPDGTFDLNYNWHNSIEKGTDAQGWVDDVGHGSHTTGSVLGNDASHITGVAPDAKFITVRALGLKGGSMFALMEGMDWLMAPTDTSGRNPRPDLAPDIVTNSWGGAPTSNPFLWGSLRNWKRAGIVPIFAAGNDRSPKPGKVAVPGMYDETITVGASDRDDSRAWFSMYGPSEFSHEKKPEITAPGVKIYSTTPDGEFHDTLIEDGKQYLWQGTSMATPHVSGAAALYLQAHPNASFEQLRSALEASGTHPASPSEEDGSGRVQVDKLIAPGSIDPKAKLADPARVAQLMDEVARSVEYPGDLKPAGVEDKTDARPKAPAGKAAPTDTAGTGVVLSPTEDGVFGS